MKKINSVITVIVTVFLVASGSCGKGKNPIVPDLNTTPNSIISPYEFKGVTFVSIPGGTFQMGNVENAPEGDPDEKPVHTVALSGYDMSVYEITNAQYAKYLNEALSSGEVTVASSNVEGISTYPGREYIYLSGYYSEYPDARCWIRYSGGTFTVDMGKDNYPVVWVSWYGAKAFALYYGLDLPTEAEWEYASRGGHPYQYGTNDGTISSNSANYHWGDRSAFHPINVKNYSPNPFGLYDMAGNVGEWCSDWYDNYSSNNQINPIGAQIGTKRVYRDGAWGQDSFRCRSAWRYGDTPTAKTSVFGFRVVRR
jgi:formylglycine-generating enzyme